MGNTHISPCCVPMHSGSYWMVMRVCKQRQHTLRNSIKHGKPYNVAVCCYKKMP